MAKTNLTLLLANTGIFSSVSLQAKAFALWSAGDVKAGLYFAFSLDSEYV